MNYRAMNDKYCFTVKNPSPELSPAVDLAQTPALDHAQNDRRQRTTLPSTSETSMLLRILIQGQDRLINAQNRQNELLEEIAETLTASSRQRQNELAQWRHSNPRLAILCRKATEKLSDIHSEFINTLSEEIGENTEIAENEFQLSDFLDRFGPRIIHLNAMLQLLSQLAEPADKH